MENTNAIILDESACFHIGDTTIIATANYQEDGDTCFDRIAGILKEEVKNQQYA